ncbi:hypothetical protein [Hydrogenovibrio kuenenii]|uniref:hypothetical protein n=1 Tax=Hydrogenovibrio kuenenii TaxID=63658 RepID=UPI00146FBC04|nr:hypothetical protein [Hydrogenovibrio kuenenii]
MLKNSSAIFALSGAILGSLLTGLIGYVSITKQTKLRLVEKVLDRKTEAHEELINFIGVMRTTVQLGGVTDGGELKRCPLALFSRKNFGDFLSEFSRVQNLFDRWLSSDIKREISLFMDYLVHLNEYSGNASDDALQVVGVIIKNDFFTFADELDRYAHVFFNKDMLSLKYKTDSEWSKHSVDVTYQKLAETLLFKNKKKILDIFNAS